MEYIRIKDPLLYKGSFSHKPIKSFFFDPEAIPSEHDLHEFRHFSESNKVKYIIWEGEPAPDVEDYFRKHFGVRSLVFNPVESLPADEAGSGKDYFSVMKQNINNIEVLF